MNSIVITDFPANLRSLINLLHSQLFSVSIQPDNSVTEVK